MKIFLLFIIFLFFLFILYLNYVDFFRYYYIKSQEDIKYYDDKYLNIRNVENTVISLTTTPKRIYKLKPTLISLLDQSKRVEKIIINIPYYSLKGEKYHIPNWLKELKNVTLNRINYDYGPATKLLPTLILYSAAPKKRIIVVDDDVIYGTRLVESFSSAFEKKKCAITSFGTDLNLPSEWPTFLRIDRNPRYVDIVMGHNGFLITPEMFPSKVFDYSNCPTECKWVDDIWFSGWLRYNSIPIYSIGFTYKAIPITCEIDSSSLSINHNHDNKNNNICINYFLENEFI